MAGVTRHWTNIGKRGGVRRRGGGIMRGRARGTLLPDTPNKYLLVGEPKISLNKIFCLKESSGKKNWKEIWACKKKGRDAKPVWFQTIPCLGEGMSIGQIEWGGRKRTTYRGEVLQLTVLYRCRMVSWMVSYICIDGIISHSRQHMAVMKERSASMGSVAAILESARPRKGYLQLLFRYHKIVLWHNVQYNS